MKQFNSAKWRAAMVGVDSERCADVFVMTMPQLSTDEQDAVDVVLENANATLDTGVFDDAVELFVKLAAWLVAPERGDDGQ